MGEEPAIDGKAEDLAALASRVLELARHSGLRIVTAESCTGGMLSSLLTDIEGLSSCFERGFAVYSDDAKTEMLGVEPKLIERYGAASAEVARAMAQGALARSLAQIAVAITGFAGPGGKEGRRGPCPYRACARTRDRSCASITSDAAGAIEHDTMLSKLRFK